MPYIYGWIKRDGLRVLDIGAGYGTVLLHLKRDKNADVLGIDPDPESVKIAREKFGVEIQDETAESFFKKNTDKFDLIIMEQTFEHLMSPLETLKELKKRLYSDGFIYIGVPNGYKFGATMSLYFQLAHTYNYSPYSFKRLAELAGLRVFDVRDPYAHPLEVLLCHPDANYPKENNSVLNIGKNYKEVLWHLYSQKFIENTRGVVKNVLVNFFGVSFKDKIKKILRA
jgi:SAM-dependent methyltransferase